MSMTRKLAWPLVAACLAAVVLAVAFVRPVQWRAQAIAGTVTGKLPLDWDDLVWILRPGSKVIIGSPPNPFRFLQNPHTSPSDIAAGELLFKQHCLSCHGANAAGGHGGPNLHDRTFVQGRSDWALYRTITHGIPGTAMVGWKLGRDNVWYIVAYLNQVLGAGGAETRVGEEPMTRIDPVTADDLLHAATNTSEWLTYSGTYTGQRHSPLNSINRDNVRQLHAVWVRQLQSKDGHRLEVSPIIRGNTMFVTALPSDVYALDISTGAILWKYKRDLQSRLAVCCEGNRGLAILGDRLYLGTMDAHLIALDANTGKVLWDVIVAESGKGYGITAAPLAVNDMIITGIAGGDFPTHGFLDAYDAASGQRRWRFDTIPSPGQPGGDTWEGGSAQRGGGSTWMTGSYDPKLGLLYWGVANPNPDFYGGNRKGDNLYTQSVVALDVATGKLRWYFQFTPHDTHDWDSAQVPMLIDDVAAFPDRHLLAFANRNGFYYLLDRVTGEFLAGAAFIRQNWADGLDAKGRPRELPTSIPTPQGIRVYPHSSGATNWWSPSYSADLGMVYVPTMDHGSIISAAGVDKIVEGEAQGGSVQEPVPYESTIPAVKALDVRTGKILWQHVSPTRDPMPEETGGLLSTAGGLVFGGDLDTFFALDAKTGAELWHFVAGGNIVAAPVTYQVAGRQFVVMTAGTSLYQFALDPGPAPVNASR